VHTNFILISSDWIERCEDSVDAHIGFDIEVLLEIVPQEQQNGIDQTRNHRSLTLNILILQDRMALYASTIRTQSVSEPI